MVKKKVVKEVKVSKPKKKVIIPTPTVVVDLKAIESKRNALIAEIKPKLLSKTQLKTGGSDIRAKYEREKGYEAVIPEINELGAKLGLRPIGLGHLRRD